MTSSPALALPLALCLALAPFAAAAHEGRIAEIRDSDQSLCLWASSLAQDAPAGCAHASVSGTIITCAYAPEPTCSYRLRLDLAATPLTCAWAGTEEHHATACEPLFGGTGRVEWERTFIGKPGAWVPQSATLCVWRDSGALARCLEWTYEVYFPEPPAEAGNACAAVEAAFPPPSRILEDVAPRAPPEPEGTDGTLSYRASCGE